MKFSQNWQKIRLLENAIFFLKNWSGVSGDGKRAWNGGFPKLKNDLKGGNLEGGISLYYLLMWVPPPGCCPPGKAQTIPLPLFMFSGKNSHTKMLLHSQQLRSLIVLQLNISYLPSNLFLIILQTKCSGMHKLLEQSGSIWTIVWMLPFAKTVETKSISHNAIGNLLILWVTLVAVLAWTKQTDLSSFLLWYQLHPGDEEKLMVELIQSYNTNNTLSSIYNIKLDIYSEMLQSWTKNSWYIWCNLFQVSPCLLLRNKMGHGMVE